MYGDTMYRARYERRMNRHVNNSYGRNFHQRHNAELLLKKRTENTYNTDVHMAGFRHVANSNNSYSRNLQQRPNAEQLLQNSTDDTNNSDVDMAGFRHITNSKNSWWWRISWTVISLVALSGCIYQCGERIHYYISDPSEINTYYIMNQTVTFPSMTVCPYFDAELMPQVDRQLFPQVHKQVFNQRSGRPPAFSPIPYVKNGTVTVSNLWEMAIVDREDTGFMTPSNMKDKTVKFQDRILYTYTTHGKCTTFLGWENVPRRGIQTLQVAMWVRTRQSQRIRIQFHEGKDTDLVKYLIAIDGLIYAYEDKDFSLQITQLIYRNTRKTPCTNDASVINKCVATCIETVIFARVTKKCRLPFMQDNNVIKPCTSAEEFSEMTTAVRNVIEGFHVQQCNCLKKCRDTIYSVNFIDSLSRGERSQKVSFGMQLSESRITVVEEAASYSGFALFSDLGGAIGLFIGISALQVIEILASFGTNISKFRK